MLATESLLEMLCTAQTNVWRQRMECNALKVQVMEQAARIIQVWWHSVATHAGLWLRACSHSLARTFLRKNEHDTQGSKMKSLIYTQGCG